MSYLKTLSNADLLEVLGYRQHDFDRREERAKESNLRSDRALADEAYTSLHAVKVELKARGVAA